jgi:hypothetical protein
MLEQKNTLSKILKMSVLRNNSKSFCSWNPLKDQLQPLQKLYPSMPMPIHCLLKDRCMHSAIEEEASRIGIIAPGEAGEPGEGVFITL